MSTVIAKNVQIGTSGTATDNFTIFQPATPDGTLRIGNGNTGITTSQVALTSAGNVGIGTTTPNKSSSSRALTVNATSGYAALELASGDTNRWYINSDGSATYDVTVGSQPRITFVNGSERMRIDSSGNVGIGTTAPTTRLSVVSATNSGISVNDGTVNTIIYNSTGGVSSFGTTTNHPIDFYTNNTVRARIDTSGNLQFNSGYGSVATAYGCRAWVNFNGVGTVAIKASGNVSSITDSGVGDFTLNFTTAMPDANYAVTSAGTGAFGVNANIGGWYTGVITNGSAVPLTKTTSAVRVYSAIVGGPAGGGDSTENYFCIFR